MEEKKNIEKKKTVNVSKSKYEPKNGSDDRKEALKAKKELKKERKAEKKGKKGDRNAKLQEKKRIRVQNKNMKKLVADMIELIREIFPDFEKNEYYRKYFNLNQCLKLEMFPEFQKAKEVYEGDNSVLEGPIKILIKMTNVILNPGVPEGEYIYDVFEKEKEKLNKLMLMYIKDS